MIKYIVFWCIVNIIPTGCPDAGVSVDEFDRIGNSMISCNVFHSKKVVECGYTKTFTDRDSAVAFYNRALLESEGVMSWQNPGIEQVRIDSVIPQSIVIGLHRTDTTVKNIMFGYHHMGDTTTGSPCGGVGKIKEK